MRCQECKKVLTNEDDAYGHDCEVFDFNTLTQKEKKQFIKKNNLRTNEDLERCLN